MNDKGNLEKKLSTENLQVVQTINCDEANFRWLMNECPMATEKLAEGIRNFGIDTVKLETLIKQKISG
jgi:transaldolase